MRILFIGGTGVISTAVSRQAVARGFDLYLLNRGMRQTDLRGCHFLTADINRPEEVHVALRDMTFDVVVDWIAYTPQDIERDLALFRGRVKQYIFISSASAYQKPPARYSITEETPLCNPFWEYSRNKIACEERLLRAFREEAFPMTIVRPSLTYDTNFPIAIGGWGCYTLADRINRGLPIIVHGDGTSLWVVTHAEDFARGFLGIAGNMRAVGEAFHITSDEVLTWDQIYRTIAEALGVEPKIVHITTDFICKIAPDLTGTLQGDKAWSTVFDNSKIKRFMPDFEATIPFKQGIQQTIAWFAADEQRQRVVHEVNAEMDRIIDGYGGASSQ
jgi:nucleoside-diphosphate-sugar epimerase